MTWLAAKSFLGLARGWWLLGAVLAILALAFVSIRVADNRDRRLVETARDAGATQPREGDLRETINRTERANEAAETIRRDADAARAECLRNARNPADC